MSQQRSIAPTSPSLSQILQGAADLIEPPGKWARDWTARRPAEKDPSLTEACLAGDPKATQWGGLGAIYCAGQRAGLSNADCWRAQEIAARCVGASRFTDWAWAPARRQGEVVTALRKAADLAASEGL